METRRLGRSGIAVSALGLGMAPLGDLRALHDDATALATVEAALAAGITLFDAAPLYGHGLAEHRLGTILKRAPRDRFVLSTKVGRVLRPLARGETLAVQGFVGGLPFAARFDYSRDGALRSIEQSLLRLATDRLDIVLIHDIDVWTHGAAAQPRIFAEALDGAYAALAQLRAEGVVRAIGIGVNEAEVCQAFAARADLDCVLLAGRYTLLEQGGLAFLDEAARRGIGVMLGGVFNSGVLATGSAGGGAYNYRPPPPAVLDRVRRLEAVCARFDTALPVAALRFALAHPAVSSAVLGAVAPEEVARNLAALATPVPPALWPALTEAGLLEPGAPTP
jgi:D-threo-aldose 1-dehydrogenase